MKQTLNGMINAINVFLMANDVWRMDLARLRSETLSKTCPVFGSERNVLLWCLRPTSAWINSSVLKTLSVKQLTTSNRLHINTERNQILCSMAKKWNCVSRKFLTMFLPRVDSWSFILPLWSLSCLKNEYINVKLSFVKAWHDARLLRLS